MLSKPDRLSIPPFQPPVVPGWAVARGQVSSSMDAAFMAGAALNTLDILVQAQPAWIGAWRQRQALKCAVIAIRLIGRNEDEAALRDAWVLRSADGNPGPAGNVLSAYRRLTARSVTINTKTLREIVDLFGIGWSDALAAIPGMVDDRVQSGSVGPLAAAAMIGEACALRPDIEPLAWWLGDWVLAQKMRWERPVPLLMGQRYSAAFRTVGGRGRVQPGEPDFDRAVCLALAQGATDACRLAAEIGRRADRLAEVSPKLRTKGADEVIRLLLSDDALSGSSPTPRLSRWASSRLFERLIHFDAVRELSGRPNFRIYGL
jgi:hypothetical protein